MTPLHILSARLQSETPVCGVALEPYILVRRADGTTVSAGEGLSGAGIQERDRFCAPTHPGDNHV